MKDRYGREIDYMRISITDRCNLRCKYCMPEGVPFVPMERILTLEEMCRVAECAAALGIRKIKVTGGEPLVRKGCCHFVQMLKSIPGIEKVTLTTNGVLLGQYLDELVKNGIDGINISLDTRNRQLFQEITGSDCLLEVMSAIETASKLSIPVKVNAVSLDLGEENWQSIVELAREYPVDVRFIEMMPIGYGKQFSVVNHQELMEKIKKTYPEMMPDHQAHGFGPAVYYRIPGFKGSVGFISAIHGKFCDSCNRVRLTSQGFLKTCLCYEEGVDLRVVLRDERLTEAERDREMERQMRQAIFGKPAAHCFEKPAEITESKVMASIGG